MGRLSSYPLWEASPTPIWVAVLGCSAKRRVFGVGDASHRFRAAERFLRVGQLRCQADGSGRRLDSTQQIVEALDHRGRPLIQFRPQHGMAALLDSCR